MSVSPDPAPREAPRSDGRGGIVSSGWLGQGSVFAHEPRRLGGGVGVSLVLHGALLLALILFGLGPGHEVLQNLDHAKLVFLESPGPGGGGGGSPAPAPPKPLEVPHHKLPPPVPVPTPVPPPPPMPVLTAPVETNVADMLQATGVSSASLASYGGGGRGTGMGPGRGSGVGPVSGGNFGGGAMRPGSGVSSPVPLKEVSPEYTTEAMQAKIQGDVRLEAVVLASGTVGDVRVTRSLDDRFGLDQEAIKAARQWRFLPGTDRDGHPQPVIVTIILSFRLH